MAAEPVSKMPGSVYLLALCQALMMTNSTLMIAVAALVGLELAEDKALATLPLSAQFIAQMATSIPASFLMKRWGRKAGFYLASLVGLLGGLIAMWSILNGHFWGFTLGTLFIGVFNGFGGYFRFAAVDITPSDIKSKAISYVMAGGVIAAFLGPNLAKIGQPILPESAYAGAYLLAAIIYAFLMLVLLFTRMPMPKESSLTEPVRSLFALFKQPKFLVAVICCTFGYSVMTLVMTATPLAMKHHDHSFNTTAFVIQWHVLAMFAPSFFTGSLIKRWGVLNILLVGALLGLLSVATNLLGVTSWHFWLGLVFLGLSWNFLFIGGTSLLTDAYLPAEKAKAQACNDFIMFSAVAAASLFAGYLQHHFGWRMVNIGVTPALGLMFFAVLGLKSISKSPRSPVRV